ncbi:MAG TPA: MASE1 domain-containing protein, partial [Luteimonas sp.]|nr:MASE1 domain-containing protein [Luteimonas sp.]
MPSRLTLPSTYAADRTILTVLVATAAWLSLTLARGPGELAAIWVGNGILAGWLLSRRTSAWPGYVACAFVAELVARMLAGDPPAYSLAIGACNILEVLVVAWLVRRRVPDLRDPRQWTGLGGIATAATLLACVLSGAGAAALAWVVNGQAFVQALATWFAAHFVGMVLVATTTLVALRGKRRLLPHRRRPWGLVATLALLVVVAVGVFSIDYPVLFLTYPPLLLAAVRHRFAGVALGVIALGLIGATATTLGHGPLWLAADSGSAAR